MVSLIDVVRYLRTEFPEMTFYPFEYPLNSPDNANLVEMRSDAEIVAGTYPLNVQIKVRDVHPSKSEATSFTLRQHLENSTNFMLGNVQVILVKSQNPVPLNMGKDADGMYLYSNNFRFMINEEV